MVCALMTGAWGADKVWVCRWGGGWGFGAPAAGLCSFSSTRLGVPCHPTGSVVWGADLSSQAALSWPSQGQQAECSPSGRRVPKTSPLAPPPPQLGGLAGMRKLEGRGGARPGLAERGAALGPVVLLLLQHWTVLLGLAVRGPSSREAPAAPSHSPGLPLGFSADAALLGPRRATCSGPGGLVL